MISDPTLESHKFADVSLVSPDLSLDLSLEKTANSPLLKLGILASGSGSNVEAIAQAIAQKNLNAQIQVLVYNQPTAKVAERADRLGISKVLLNHREYASREALDQAIIATLRQHQVEWVIMAGWMRVVTQVLINAFPGHILNIHPSLLPSFPGAHAIEQAIAAQVKITGCTVHFVELVVDSGPIIMQAAVPVFPDDTPATLHQRIQVQEHKIFPQAIAIAANLISGKLNNTFVN
jgi:phosphoribosylglycinamide formyltransferase 1